MATKDKGMYFQADYWDALSVLPRKDADTLSAAIVRYWFTGEEPKLKSGLLAVFLGMKGRIDVSKTRQQNASKSRAKAEQKPSKTLAKPEQNASETLAKAEVSIKSEREKENKETSPNGEVKKAAGRFRPPTADEVRSYAAEKGLSIDADRFCDFYASKGWKVGSSPMRDWKAAARNWAARERKGEDRGAYSGAYSDVF